jgi:4-hydroxy-4-methyl-2-oxoglutarate aldolase
MIELPTALTISRSMRRPTKEQVAAFQNVQTGFVVDALMGKGAFSAEISPIGDGRDMPCVAAGPALTADCGPADVLATMAALNFVEPGDILVSAFGGFQGCAAAGDRVTGMLKNCDGKGFVTDGPMRDYVGIIDVGLPVWCTSLTPGSPFSSGPGTVGLSIQIAGQRVETGDMIVADMDGVVVVPYDKIDNVIEKLKHIKKLEAELDAKVISGLKVPEPVQAVLASDQTIYVD